MLVTDTNANPPRPMYKTHPRERVYFLLMGLPWIGLLLTCLAVASFNPGEIGVIDMVGTGILYALSALVILAIAHLELSGLIRRSGARVTEKQFPKLFEVVERQARLLGFKKAPPVYIIEGGGVLNAFAFLFRSDRYVVLFSRLVEAAYVHGEDKVLEFIVGHELGHLRHKHGGFWKVLYRFPSQILLPFLERAYSRACEYTCDRAGCYLAPEGAARGMLLLTVGTRLLKEVDLEEYLKTSREDRGLATWFVNIFATHPSFSDRIEAIDDFLKGQEKRSKELA